MDRKRLMTTLAFLILTLGGGLVIGFLARPGEWYMALAKPSFQPPGWLFGPVWTLLYVMIGIAGSRIWLTAPRSPAMRLWFTQLSLNFLWSPLFFALHKPTYALVIILAMLATILAFIRTSWAQHRVAAYLFLPYAAWVSFATLLNLSTVWLNPGL